MSSPGDLRRFPGSNRIVVARSAGRRARHVPVLAGSSDWRRALLDRAASAAVLAVGTRPLARADRWPWPDLGPVHLAEMLRGELPALRLLGAVSPRQADRRRLSVLGQVGGNLVVVKFSADDGTLDAEVGALRTLGADPLPGIATPRLLAAGSLAGQGGERITYVAATALGVATQRPAIDVPLHTFEADLTERLHALHRPADVPSDWIPVHGDLAPWNLRRTSRGLALFDWEAAGWGPPGSDIAHYRRTCDEVRPWWRRTGAPAESTDTTGAVVGSGPDREVRS